MDESEPIYCQTMDSPLGKIRIGATPKGICLIDFPNESEQEKPSLCQGLASDHLVKAINQLGEYFNGSRKTFSIPIDAKGSEFQKAVWSKILEIPYGKTISYKQLSENMCNPLAIRAIAVANGANPIPILIPCHRVIGSNGKLTGYSGGLWRKAWLLKLEKADGLTLFD